MNKARQRGEWLMQRRSSISRGPSGCEPHSNTTQTPLAHGEVMRSAALLPALVPVHWRWGYGDNPAWRLALVRWPSKCVVLGPTPALLVVRIHSGMNRAPDSLVYQSLIRQDPTGRLVLNGGDLIKWLLIILPCNTLLYPVIRPGTPKKQDHEPLSGVCCHLRRPAALPPQGQPGWCESSIRAIKISKNASKASIYRLWPLA